MAEVRAADAAVRAQALEPGRSCIVQAPAGSGKTELLIQRMLALLATVEQPEQVLAITFTRKAAAEMRTRLLEALAQAGREPDTGDLPEHARAARSRALAVLAQDRAQGWNLMEMPARLRILTIDALCAALVRDRPLNSALGEAPRPTEQPDAHYVAAARALLAELERQGPVADAMERLLLHLDGNYGRMLELLCAMLARRDQWLRHVGAAQDLPGLRAALEADWREVVRDGLATIRGELLAWAEQGGLDLAAELAVVGPHAAGFVAERNAAAPIAALGSASLPPAEPEALPQWQGLADLFTTATGTWRKSLTKTQGFPTDAGAGDPQALKAMRDRGVAVLTLLSGNPDLAGRLRAAGQLPSPTYTESQWAVVEALLVLLPRAVQHLRAVFAETGECDYGEIALAAVRTLEPTAGSRPDAADAVGAPVRHILVDEFQDTSHSQFRLLECLTAAWPADGSHTLFLVGDPMQSIYRFREAEVGLFLRAKHEGVGHLPLESLSLTVNFRSGAGLVAWVNTVFPAVLPGYEDAGTGAVPFARAEAHHAGDPGPAVHVHPLLRADGESREDLDDREAARVVDIVRQVRSERPDERIAILVRTRTLLRAIVPALAAAGSPAQAVDIESLSERPEVRDLVMLARALSHTGDRVAWLAVLRAPWCGLTLADLLHLAGESPQRALWSRLTDAEVTAGLSADGRGRVARVVAALSPALADRERRGARRWVEGAWLALGGPAVVPRAAWPNVDACLARLESLGGGSGPAAPESIEGLLENLYAAPDPGADERLQVLTLHKSKGLQFDTVILPGLGHPARSDDPPLLRWIERPLPAPEGAGLLLAPIPAPRPEPDAMFDYLGEMEKAKAAHEVGRLLYVAATRARRALHLIGHTKLDEGAPAPPPGGTLLARLWHHVQDDFNRAAADPAVAPAESPAILSGGEEPATGLHRLPSDWQAPAPPPSLSRGGEADSSPHPAAPAVEFRWAGEMARHVGTVVHRLLRLLALEDDGGRAEPAAAPELPHLNPAAVEAALAALGVGAGERPEAVRRVLDAVAATFADPRGRWILQAHSQARSEYDLTTVVEGRAARSVIDRTFVADGVRWIVDFKTGSHRGTDVEHFLDEEVARYRPQLERYAGILRRLEPERPVRLALYFPLLQAWREWPAPEPP